jgi:hypothetical protein
MQIIRDKEFHDLTMIPLFVSWNLHRCNIRDCKEKQTTIVVDLIDRPFALCEKHFEECSKTGKIDTILDFDL